MPIRPVIESFEYDPETFDPEDFKKTLLAEFDKDESVWRAKVTQQDEAIRAAQTENTNLKATNYDLLNKVPASTEETSGKTDDKDPTDVAIDDLFGS